MDSKKLKQFLALPVNENETWQGGWVPIEEFQDPKPTSGLSELGIPSSKPNPLVMVLWTSVTTELASVNVEKNADEIAEKLLEGMLKFYTEQEFPFRPGRIECNDEELIAPIQQALNDSGTDVEYSPAMSQWSGIVSEFKSQLTGHAPAVPSLVESGCQLTQIIEYAEAASQFYAAGLWQYLEDIDLIEVTSPEAPAGFKHAVVLGCGAEANGLGLFKDPEEHYAMTNKDFDPEEISLFSLTFGDRTATPKNELILWDEHQLPVEGSEAYPFSCLYLPDAVRRPTDHELEYLTQVLLGLAATTEADIDSGAWEKEIQFQGRPVKTGFRFPDLIDPPDREEWIRRGVLPDIRISERHIPLVQQFIAENESEMSLDELNAAINERFVGEFVDVEYSTDTPAERAVALTWQAIEAFGRRRVILARQAISEDPTHVEANVLVAEMTYSTEERIKLFHAAKEFGRLEMGDDFEELTGCFWGVPETRPFMRACQGLAESLAFNGQANEAIEQYREMLTLNPEDNQGVRYEIIPLLIEQNREKEAIDVLNLYEEETGFWHYTRSLVEYRKSGESSESKKCIREAFRLNKHLPEMFESNEPPNFSDHYALGSAEEASAIIRELSDLLIENSEFVIWMIHQYKLWIKEKQNKSRKPKRKTRPRKSR